MFQALIQYDDLFCVSLLFLSFEWEKHFCLKYRDTL